MEFDAIERFFLPLSQDQREAERFRNDGAVLDIPHGEQMVVSSDTVNAGVHFFPDQNPQTIAKKALRTNLSDIAAMGARPYCYQLCLSLPEYNEDWLAKFSAALAEDQDKYGVFLSGGDTTSTKGALSVSITAFGLVPKGSALKRSGARADDLIFITGHVGDAYCGLQSLRGQMQGVPDNCVDTYYAPDPPVYFGRKICGLASAALDISDGLIADLAHMAKASHLNAIVELDGVIFSQETQSLLETGAVTKEQLMTGGDDYQLVFTSAPDRVLEIEKTAKDCGVAIQQIGIMQEGDPDVLVLDENGLPIEFETKGWQHF